MVLADCLTTNAAANAIERETVPHMCGASDLPTNVPRPSSISSSLFLLRRIHHPSTTATSARNILTTDDPARDRNLLPRRRLTRSFTGALIGERIAATLLFGRRAECAEPEAATETRCLVAVNLLPYFNIARFYFALGGKARE